MISSKEIKEKALQIGFDACGIARVDTLRNDAQYLSEWLNKGYHAEMGYMANHFEKRINPHLLVEGAKSVIVVLLNYFPPEKQSAHLPQIAQYAYGKDYHVVVKDKLHQLLDEIKTMYPEQTIAGRAFVDSAPVLERAWAVQAGLGWIGKNTNLIHPTLGSFVFIGELIINAEFDKYDTPLPDQCGTCERCLNACPTQALETAHCLNANRCISYLTIESKKDIPTGLAAKLGNRIFGCDTCQNVCPFNQDLDGNKIPEFAPSKSLFEMNFDDWKVMKEDEFEQEFADSPLKRAGLERIQKTLLSKCE